MIREHIIKRFVRSPSWSKTRKEHLKTQNVCSICGGVKKLEVHHIKPPRLYPELELDPSNLITLCRKQGCHFIFGHLFNWGSWNRYIKEDSNTWFWRIKYKP